MRGWPGAAALVLVVIGVAAAPRVAAADVTSPKLTATAAQLIQPGGAPAVAGAVSGAAGTDIGGAPVAVPGSTVISGGSWDSSIGAGQAQATVDGAALFDGEITFSTATAQAQIAGDGSLTASASVSGLVVLGVAQTPVPGSPLALGTWGSLVVGAPQAAGVASTTSSEAAITITLTADHGGLPAGSQLTIAQVQITPGDSTTPPASTGTGSGQTPGSDPPAKDPTTKHAGKVTLPVRSPNARHHGGGRQSAMHRRALTTHPKTLPEQVGLRIVAWAASQIGWPYVWGGDSEVDGGFDCSGLVDFAYASAGYPLPGRPTAEVLLQMSQPIAEAQLRPGDLVFLQTASGYAYHVALYAGNGEVIVAAHHGALVARVPLTSVAWTSYGRIWAGGTLEPKPAQEDAATLLAKAIPANSHATSPAPGNTGRAGIAAPLTAGERSVPLPATPAPRRPTAVSVWSDHLARAPVAARAPSVRRDDAPKPLLRIASIRAATTVAAVARPP